MKRETIYILVAVVFVVAIIVIYYFYTKNQTRIAEERLKVEQAAAGNKVNLFDTVKAIGTGLGVFGSKTTTTAA